MDERTGTSRPGRDGTTGWARGAGGLLVLVGLVNASFGVLSLATDLVRLSPGAAGGLLVVGLLTVLLGVRVWQGSRLAAAVGLTAFGALLVLQLGDAAAGGTATGEGAGPRLGVLAVLVIALGLAVRAGRARSPRRARQATPPQA